jgi:hypothetical protein
MAARVRDSIPGTPWTDTQINDAARLIDHTQHDPVAVLVGIQHADNPAALVQSLINRGDGGLHNAAEKGQRLLQEKRAQTERKAKADALRCEHGVIRGAMPFGLCEACRDGDRSVA